jgi:hypothetical protein
MVRELNATHFPYTLVLLHQVGNDLAREHERYLCEQHFGIETPVFVTDYPRAIKPFYMRVNDDEVRWRTIFPASSSSASSPSSASSSSALMIVFLFFWNTCSSSLSLSLSASVFASFGS